MDEIKPLFHPWWCKCGGDFDVYKIRYQGESVQRVRRVHCSNCGNRSSVLNNETAEEVIKKLNWGIKNG